MRYNHTKWPTRLAAVATILVMSIGAAAGATAQSVSGQSYGAYVQTPVASQSRTPMAVLPSDGQADGQIVEASGDALSVPGAFSSEFLSSMTTGATGAGKAGAQSIATVAEVSILNGLISASRVFGVASATRVGGSTVSDANGSSFEGLSVGGVSVADDVAPNTRMSLPGVGYVVLNEQIQNASGITVNMIHVVLQGLFGSKVGEIIVGSATSSVS